MSFNGQEYLTLKKDLETLQREHDRLVGAAQEVAKNLKEEFGCEDLDDAKKKLKVMKKEAEEAAKKANEQLEKVIELYADVIKHIEGEDD